MRVILTVAFVATLLACGYCDKDWDAISNKVSDIEGTIQKAAGTIKAIATKDNEKVGKEIAEKIKVFAAAAYAINSKTRAQIQDKSLTQEKGKEFSKELGDLLTKLKDDCKPDIQKLSEGAAGKISEAFKTGLMDVHAKTGELDALLA